jgi:hypothetical protein
MADELGYLFDGRQHSSALGCLELEVNLYARPTKQHFDPEEAIFPVVGLQGEITHQVIVHPWHAGKTYRVCVGRIILRDRLGKTVEAFSFGGELAIAVEQAYTGCLLRSPAPIFALTDLHGLSMLFVSRFEALLAREHTAWNKDDTGFGRQLAGIKPDKLFVAGLAAVAEQFDHTSAAVREGRYWHDAAALHRATQNMKADGSWPPSIPSLGELLACPE